jgi:hypothetical protein
VADTVWDELFEDLDDDAFRDIVGKNLAEGAYRLHQISPAEYVSRCRQEWRACGTDEVYAMKILVDKKFDASQPNALTDLEVGFEVTDLVKEPDEDLYCVAIGLIRPDGTLVGAPPDYDQRPPLQGRQALVLAVDSDIPSEEPETPSVATHIICLFDVLGFSDRLAREGLPAIQALYDKLIETALKPHVGNLWTPFLASIGPSTYHPGLFWLPLRFAYFSDSILLWAPAHPNCIGPFLDRCLNVFCEALNLGAPLRGAIAAGDLVLHQQASFYLGQPLVEAARLEQAQEWIGVSLGVSVRSEDLRLPFSPLQVMIWDSPMKPGREELLSGIVLDWPRRWRELHPETSAEGTILTLRKEGFERYYDNAVTFVRHSDANADWFLAAMPPVEDG